MNLSARENYLRTIEFSNPQWIPCSVSFSLATWLTQEKELAAIMAEHPLLFGQVKPRKTDLEHLPPVYKPGYFKDNWGCLWHNKIAGLEGMIVDHPLADWAAFDTYAPPDFNLYSERGTRDWAAIEADFAWKRKQGELTIGDGERLFDRLYFLRGFENLLMDIAEDHPRLPLLIEMLWQYEMGLIKKWLEIGVDALSFHTDIGTQRSLMISPAHFRKYLKPMFKDLFMTVRKAGAHVLLSSDGVLLEIVDDLIECGVSMHDPQLRANTLEGIRTAYKGKMCINLDLDRQMYAFCTPEDIWQQVRTSVETLNLPQGGLMVSGSVHGDNVPLKNIKALCAACESICLADKQ